MIGIFSPDEIEKINSILKLIMPAGETGMPEAELIFNSIDLANTNHTKFVELSKIICNKIDLNQIKNEEDLNQFKKVNFREFSVFVNMVMILYYSNKTVLSKLEVGSVPPFPEGNFVKEGDIYLLEQVFLREKIYKD
jgi:hypothetical protein